MEDDTQRLSEHLVHNHLVAAARANLADALGWSGAASVLVVITPAGWTLISGAAGNVSDEVAQARELIVRGLKRIMLEAEEQARG